MGSQTLQPLDLALLMVMSISPRCLEKENPIFIIQDIFDKNKFIIYLNFFFYGFVSFSLLHGTNDFKLYLR